jgi:hypothetical protein
MDGGSRAYYCGHKTRFVCQTDRNNRFFNPAFRLQASTPPAIEHLSFASADSCTESTAEPSSLEPSSPEPSSEHPSSLERAMIQQQAMMKDAVSSHTPSPLPANADTTVTGTDILYLAPRPTGAGLPRRKFAAQWLHGCLQSGSRRAKFDIGVRSSKDGKSGAGGGLWPHPED